MFADPLHLCIALGPLAGYLLLLGAVNSSSRPLLTSGTRDLAALAVAISGLMLAGPMELFMPEAALARFGGFAWTLMLAVYVLAIVLIALLMRPRLVVFNIDGERFRTIAQRVAEGLDAEAQWAGDMLALPNLGVQLTVEVFSPVRHVALVAAGSHQHPPGWRRLEEELREAIREERCPINPAAISLMTFGLLMVVIMAMSIYFYPEALVQAFREMLWLDVGKF